MAFPTSVSSLARPGAATYTDDPGFELDVVLDAISDDLEAVETKVGTGASTPTTAGDVLHVTGAGATAHGPRALVRLAETIVTGSVAANIDFTSIPSTYRSLMLVLYGRGDTAATNATVLVRFNNDSAGNYDYQAFYGTGATAAAFEGLAQTSIQAGSIPAATATADVAGHNILLIPRYAGTTFQKTLDATVALKLGTSTGNLTARNTSGFWRSTAAINRITLTPGAGNFAIGTVATLYGIPV